MKLSIPLLLVSTVFGLAQTSHTLRLVGSNVIDFNPLAVAKISGSVSLTNTYRVRGEIKAFGPLGATVLRDLGTSYQFAPKTELTRGIWGAKGDLMLAGASNMGHNGRISESEYLALSQPLALQFQKVIETEWVIVTNAPKNVKVGDTVDYLAIPSGFEPYTYDLGEKRTAKRFGLGTTVSPSSTPAVFYYQITTNRPIKRPLKAKKTR